MAQTRNQGCALPPIPERLACEKIDTQLMTCGLAVQDYAVMDFGAERGPAAR